MPEVIIEMKMKIRFDPELTARIKKYKDAKYFFGKGIRWMIADENGTHVYCDKCGNIANGVLFEQVERYTLKIPICKKHIEDWMNEYPEYRFHQNILSVITDNQLLKMAESADRDLAERLAD